MFKRVLIANRGEIAVRITSTLQQMGIRVIAICSEVDRESFHLVGADEIHELKGKTAAETYLRGEKIIEIARKSRADAIHPGYGFLSEDAEFAEMCVQAGLCFIGPPSTVINSLGDKVEAKRMLQAAGVPVVPGWTGEAGKGMDVLAEARRVGYPLLVKAAAGGGGKGMRVVHVETELVGAVESAEREAKAAFGDGRVFFERYIAKARHVEFQILGDEHGNVVHLFERECSLQRRHQKVIEETPSTALDSKLRERMGDAAVRAAKAVRYTNAGTVEFLVDDRGEFYFLEVNTRLQVEHPITEMTLGLDLVELQVRIAAGEPLPFRQLDLLQRGHAIECRVCAEDPGNHFLPSIGRIARYRPPNGPYIRVDSGVVEGSVVSVHYDSLLAKLIVWGRDRIDAMARMHWALSNFVVLGVTTNIEYLRMLIDTDGFKRGRLHTRFLDEHPLVRDAEIPPAVHVAAAMAFEGSGSYQSENEPTKTQDNRVGPWVSAGSWRGF